MFKKTLLSVLFAAMAFVGYAQDNVTVSGFTLDAGVAQTEAQVESQTIDLILNNEKPYGGMQFYLSLPAGVSLYESSTDGIWFDYTDRLKLSRTKYFSVKITKQGDGSYFFVIYNDENKTIAGNSGEPILTLYLTVSDPEAFETGTKQCAVTDLRLAAIGGNPEDGTRMDNLSSDCTLRVMAKTAASGYGSFSWPHDLDFSNAGVEAYVAEKDENCIVSLNPVKLVPAGTGIVIKGNPSTSYYPETTDEGGVATSVLTGTADGAYTVASDNIYAISTKEGKTAFYPVAQGVAVPLYKAFLTHEKTAAEESAAADFLNCDFVVSSGIEVVENNRLNSADDAYHTIDGVKVKQPAQRGLYIHNGSKVVVK